MRLRYWGIWLSLGYAAIIPLACSLSTFRPTPVQIALKNRPGPSLNAMSYFAIAITGGSLTNSLTSASVGNRSLNCLKLNGQISFPYTYAQITAGVPIALAAGNYQFTIIGFSDAVAGATTVAQMYTGSPSLKTFLISQLSATVTPGQTVQLTSAYNGGTATDLQVACPPAGHTLYALTLNGQLPFLYSRDLLSTGWSSAALPDGATIYGSASLAFGDTGARASLGADSSAGLNFAMLPNIYQQIATNVVTGNLNVSAIAVTEDGVSHVLANVDQGGGFYAVKEFTGPAWTQGDTVFPNSIGYENFKMIEGPGNRLLAATNVNVAAAGFKVSEKVGGSWTAPVEIASLDGNPCVARITRYSVAYDSLNRAYVAYVCGGGQDKIGIAHNRSGSWTDFLVRDLSGVSINDLDLLIIDGQIHLVYATTNGVSYVTASESGLSFSLPVNARTVNNATESVYQAAITGSDATHLYVIGMEFTSLGNRLAHYTNISGAWMVEIIDDTLTATDTLHKRVFLR